MSTASYTQAKEFAITRGNQQHPFTLNQFMDEAHRMFYSHVDISFKNYFMEIVEQEGQFAVHHSKLVEYGVMTSERSGDVKKKLDALGMVEDVDYLLRDISQQMPSGVKHSKSYILTPESFKKCLMRARRYPGQDADPAIYADYFLLLEKLVKLFSLYELTKKDAEIAASRRMLSERDQRIETMFEEIQREREEAQRREEAAQREREEAKREREAAKQREEAAQRRDAEQQRKINELLGYAVETKEALAETNVKLDDVKTELVDAKVDRYEFKKQFSLVIDQLDEMSEQLDEAKEEFVVIQDKLDVTEEKLDIVTENLDAVKEELVVVNDQLEVVNDQLEVVKEKLFETEVDRDEKLVALNRQMVVAGALCEDKSRYHSACILTRRVGNDLEVMFIGRQLNAIDKKIKDLQLSGFKQALPIFFTVDPVSLRNAHADKNRHEVKGMLGYANRAIKHITNAFLANLGFKNGRVAVPRIGSLKTFIPNGSIFDLENYIANVGLVLSETTGMDLTTASKLAEHYMSEMKSRDGESSMGAALDADMDAVVE